MAVKNFVNLFGTQYDLADGANLASSVETTSTAAYAHSTGEYFLYNGLFYVATKSIAVGNSISVGTNCERVHITDALASSNANIAALDATIEPLMVNLADPKVEPVHLYPNGNEWGAANFINTLPVKVRPNTTYTIIQSPTVSKGFRVASCPEKPAANGTITVNNTTIGSSPLTITTGASDYWLGVEYYDSRDNYDGSTPIPATTLMVAEGIVSEFIPRGKLTVPKDALPLSYEPVTAEGAIICDEFEKDTEIALTASAPSTFIVSNENLLIPADYETLTSKTENGITFTVNADLSITANGTASANANFYFKKTTAPAIYRTGVNVPLCFTCLPDIPETDDYFAYLNNAGMADTGEGVVYTSNTIALANGFIRIRSGKTVNNVTFKPMLSYGVVKKPFVTPNGYILSGITSTHIKATGGVMTITSATGVFALTGYRSAARSAKLLAESEVRQRNWMEYRQPYVISGAHRGFLTEAPENTIYAIRAAVEAGVDFIESDIQFTSDNVPVMFHDATINRIVTGHTGAIADYTWEQVQEFDCYTYFEEAYPAKWKEEYANARILSLEQFLQIVKGLGVKANLEIKVISSDNYVKAKQIRAVRSLIEEYDYARQITWAGTLTSSDSVMRLMMDNPDLAFTLILDGVTPSAANLATLEMFNTGRNVIGISTDQYNELSDDVLRKYLIAGYTIDTAEDALALNPYVKMAISNSINVKAVLKAYYMGVTE